jgi:hypothetical protein
MAKALLFDFMSHGFGHTSFNRCMVEVAMNIEGIDGVVLFAEKEHLEILNDLLPSQLKSVCETVAIDTIPTSMYSSLLLSWQAARKATELMGRAVAQYGAKEVFVLGYTGILLRELRRSTLAESVNLEMLGHGNVADITVPVGRNPFRSFQSMHAQMRKPLPKGMRFISLEKDIATELSERWQVNSAYIKVLEQAFRPTADVDVGARKAGLDFGFIGDPRPQKGFDQFLESALRSKDNSFRFHVIGRKVPQMQTTGLEALSTLPSDGPLSRAIFLSMIQSMDLICAPFLPAYRLIPSGSLLDAINQLKPLVYPQQRHFEVFVKRYGPIGYSFSDSETMSHVLSRLSVPEFLEHRKVFEQSLLKFQEDRMPDRIGKQF